MSVRHTLRSVLRTLLQESSCQQLQRSDHPFRPLALTVWVSPAPGAVVHGEDNGAYKREDIGQGTQQQHIGDVITVDHVFVHRKLRWKLQGCLDKKVCDEVPGHSEHEAEVAEEEMEGGGVVAGAEELRVRGAGTAVPDGQCAEHQRPQH